MGKTYHLTFHLRNFAHHMVLIVNPIDALSTCYDGMFHCYSIAVHALSESFGVPNTCQAFIFLPSGALVGTVNSEIFKVP